MKCHFPNFYVLTIKHFIKHALLIKCFEHYFFVGSGGGVGQCSRLNNKFALQLEFEILELKGGKKMHFQFVTKITLVLISLAMNSRSLVISFFVILFGLTVTAYDIDENIVNLGAITCIYSQTSLSLT